MDSSQMSPVRLPNPTAESFVASLKVVHFFAIIFFWLLLASLLLHLGVFVLVQAGIFDQTQDMGYVPRATEAHIPADVAANDTAEPLGGPAVDEEESAAATQPSSSWWSRKRAEDLLFYARPLMAAMRLVGLLSSMLLLVTLFIYLQISLLGRLAGIRFLTVAFFLMMFCVATVFSWEPLLPGTRILGSLYMLGDFIQHKQELGSHFLDVAYYWFRFLVMPIVSLLLLVASWLRFRRGYEESVLMNQ